MKLFKLHVGYNPRRHPAPALFCAVPIFFGTILILLIVFFMVTPIHLFGGPMGLIATWYDADRPDAIAQVWSRIGLAFLAAATGATVAFRRAYDQTPLTEPFQQVSEGDPKLYYGEYARDDLRQRLFAEAGSKSSEGLYIAPHLAIPRASETKNILVIGAPGCGKSNILRAFSDQAIDRGDRVLLLCNKGDVTSAFTADEAVLIAAHHRDSYALDLAADITDVAGAAQFASDIVPASNPPFWSDCARAVLTDIILTLQARRPGAWNARMLLQAALSDFAVIQKAIAKIDLNAGPLIQGSDPDAEDKTVTGILLTMRSAAFANLRPLAWAWDQAPPERRFSVKAWMSKKYAGPKTVIVQFSPEYEALSTLIAGNLIRRVTKRLADPQTAIDPKRRVVMVLDEFHVLGKIEGLESALAVGREKGLVVMLGIQSVDQLVEKYEQRGANLLAALFQIKIYGRLVPGGSAKTVEEWLGDREVSAMIENRSPAMDDRRKRVEERKRIPTFSITQLSSELGISENAQGAGCVRAVVHCYGHAYVLEWPLTTWRKKRRGFIPAPWLTQPPAR